jgi:hypothetical protein
MTWKYGLIKTSEGYGLHEIYTDDKSFSWTEEPIFSGESKEEVLVALRMMTDDIINGIIYEVEGDTLKPLSHEEPNN